MLDPVTLVLVPSVVGGVVLALLIFRLQHRGSRQISPDAFRDTPLSTDVINMAHIRVAGVGGLGLVAMAAWVAFNVPRIGQVLAIGLVTGAALAAVLIYRRRARGPMPSSGERPGANTVLSIDAPSRPARETARHGDDVTRRVPDVSRARA
jgi:hypothetical protein